MIDGETAAASQVDVVTVPLTVDVLTIGGRTYKTINDEHFTRIRAYFSIPDSFAASKDSFDFSKMAAAGGKGGDPMARTSCSGYFIKEMNAGDHKTLLGLAEDLAEQITNPDKPSILAPLIAHFWGEDGKKSYLAMTNCMTSKGPYLKMYDLKGCADDKLLVDDGERVHEVHKRVWNLGLWCGCGGDPRSKYFNGKLEALHKPMLEVTLTQKKQLMAAIENDCAWLLKHNLMDFSLLAGVVETDPNESELPGRPSLYAGSPCRISSDSGTHTTYFGIIDYLQKWNNGKVIAKAVKFSERNKATVPPIRYTKRFVNHFSMVIIGVDQDLESQIAARDNVSKPMRCFPLAKR